MLTVELCIMFLLLLLLFPFITLSSHRTYPTFWSVKVNFVFNPNQTKLKNNWLLFWIIRFQQQQRFIIRFSHFKYLNLNIFWKKNPHPPFSFKCKFYFWIKFWIFFTKKFFWNHHYLMILLLLSLCVCVCVNNGTGLKKFH